MILTEKLNGYFSRRPEVISVYIFGSQTGEKARKDSDIDVALLVSETALINPLTYRIELTTDLMALLKKPVDVIILNLAHLLLRAQIFQKGNLIFERDSKMRVSFQAKSMGLYYDYKKYFEFHSRVLKEKIKSVGLG